MFEPGCPNERINRITETPRQTKNHGEVNKTAFKVT